MYQIDMEKFGGFLLSLRKKKNLTQKELGEKLFVSDKTVSKWERGLSIPNVSLLIPLAEILGVTVTELLKGERIQSETLELPEIEDLVTRSVDLSIHEQKLAQQRKQKWSFIYFACLAITILEIGLMTFFGYTSILEGSLLYLIVALSFIFAMWFCLFAKETLPSYYDDNEIDFVSIGLFRMNIPGIHFNNQNWLLIINALRIYLLLLGTGYPAIHFLLFGIFQLDPHSIITAYLSIPLVFGIFFVAYFVAHKYESEDTKKDKKRKRIFLITIVLIIIAAFIVLGNELGFISYRSATRIGYIGNETSKNWTGNYYYLDGSLKHTLYPETDSDTLQINVVTEKGTISIEVDDADGNVLFAEKDIDEGNFDVEVKGKIVVLITAEKHEGSFSIGF